MGRVDGKVAFITGAARGQGRSHALRLAQEGADIIGIDICEQIATVPYGMGTLADLEETARQVEALDRRVIIARADVRDASAVRAVLSDAVTSFGRLDIVCANAGIFSMAPAEELTSEQWQDMLDVNLTGVWNTCQAAIPYLRAGGGGSMILTSSGAGFQGIPNFAHYTAAKHGVIGVMKTLANELAASWIRVNCVVPSTVATPLAQNDMVFRSFRPDLEAPTLEDTIEVSKTQHALPEPWTEPIDISNGVLFLASDEARFITGVALPVDLGRLVLSG